MLAKRYASASDDFYMDYSWLITGSYLEIYLGESLAKRHFTTIAIRLRSLTYYQRMTGKTDSGLVATRSSQCSCTGLVI